MKLFIPGLFFLFLASSHKKEGGAFKMPVNIYYMEHPPPDSIQDFIKVFLLSKKLEVIKFGEAMSLFQQEMQSEVMDWMATGKISKINEGNKAEFSRSLDPVCNVLGITIFNDTTTKNYFNIDSIHWFLRSLPPKDTNKINRRFIPDTGDKTNPYPILKIFLDKVIASNLLK